MKKLILLSAIFFVSSCVSYVKVSETESSITIKDLQLDIGNVKELEWKVGRNQDQIISRGVNVELDLPKFSDEQIENISSKYKVDHLMIQVKRRYRGVIIPVGTVIMPFSEGKRIPKKAFIDLLYYSAIYRPSYIQYKCVPFNLSYKLDKFKVRERGTYTKDITVSSAYDKKLRDKAVVYTFQAPSLTSGRDLVGEYFFSMAFYDSKENIIKSSVYEYLSTLQVISEHKEDVRGCTGYRGEGEILNKGEKIKFGR
jgi:hypothetical protein